MIHLHETLGSFPRAPGTAPPNEAENVRSSTASTPNADRIAVDASPESASVRLRRAVLDQVAVRDAADPQARDALRNAARALPTEILALIFRRVNDRIAVRRHRTATPSENHFFVTLPCVGADLGHREVAEAVRIKALPPFVRSEGNDYILRFGDDGPIEATLHVRAGSSRDEVPFRGGGDRSRDMSFAPYPEENPSFAPHKHYRFYDPNDPKLAVLEGHFSPGISPAVFDGFADAFLDRRLWRQSRELSSDRLGELPQQSLKQFFNRAFRLDAASAERLDKACAALPVRELHVARTMRIASRSACSKGLHATGNVDAYVRPVGTYYADEMGPGKDLVRVRENLH